MIFFYYYIFIVLNIKNYNNEKKVFILTVAFSFFSCSENSLMNSEVLNDVTPTLRSGGDGIYDVLGYRYDCTQSDFIGTAHARLPVIDVAAFIAGGNVINTDELHNDIIEKQKWGYNFSEFQKDVERTIDVNVGPISQTSKILPLFTGFLKTTFISNANQ